MEQVVDAFWPRIDGWRSIATEPGYFSVLFILQHPKEGCAAMLLGSVEPGKGLGTVEAWDSLSVAARARNIHVSFHAHGATRLDLLDQFVEAQTAGDLTSGDADMFERLTGSPVFIDQATTAMLALNPAFESLNRKAEVIRNLPLRRALAAQGPEHAASHPTTTRRGRVGPERFGTSPRFRP